ncbi:hypothetical protein Droror1_Dr00025368 [Drosera rotundifolia]
MLTFEEKDSVDIGGEAKRVEDDSIDRKVIAKLVLTHLVFIEILRSSIVKTWLIQGSVECKAMEEIEKRRKTHWTRVEPGLRKVSIQEGLIPVSVARNSSVVLPTCLAREGSERR